MGDHVRVVRNFDLATATDGIDGLVTLADPVDAVPDQVIECPTDTLHTLDVEVGRQRDALPPEVLGERLHPLMEVGGGRTQPQVEQRHRRDRDWCDDYGTL